jgi:hypothetical protein
MRWHEIMESASAGATSAGSVSVVQQPLGMISRNAQGLLTGKYSTDSTPNTPKEYKRTNHVSGRFKNSISN